MLSEEKTSIVREAYAENPALTAEDIKELLGLKQIATCEKYLDAVTGVVDIKQAIDLSYYTFRLLDKHGALQDLDFHKHKGSIVILKEPRTIAELDDDELHPTLNIPMGELRKATIA